MMPVNQLARLNQIGYSMVLKLCCWKNVFWRCIYIFPLPQVSFKLPRNWKLDFANKVFWVKQVPAESCIPLLNLFWDGAILVIPNIENLVFPYNLHTQFYILHKRSTFAISLIRYGLHTWLQLSKIGLT